MDHDYECDNSPDCANGEDEANCTIMPAHQASSPVSVKQTKLRKKIWKNKLSPKKEQLLVKLNKYSTRIHKNAFFNRLLKK